MHTGIHCVTAHYPLSHFDTALFCGGLKKPHLPFFLEIIISSSHVNTRHALLRDLCIAGILPAACSTLVVLFALDSHLNRARFRMCRPAKKAKLYSGGKKTGTIPFKLFKKINKKNVYGAGGEAGLNTV